MSEDEHTARIKEYILHYQAHFDRYLLPLCDPSGKRVLVVGSGWGAETFWALSKGARFVLGLDPAERPTTCLKEAMHENNISFDGRFEHRQGLTSDVKDGEFEPFDLIISHNVMEHVFGLAHTLSSCRRFIPGRGARIAIFADPLFYASAGSHLDLPPWGHLAKSQEDVRKSVPPGEFEYYKTSLNGMTLTSFLGAVREAGLWMEQIGIVPDRNISRYNLHANDIPAGMKPFDLLCEGVFCLLGFPENI